MEFPKSWGYPQNIQFLFFFCIETYVDFGIPILGNLRMIIGLWNSIFYQAMPLGHGGLGCQMASNDCSYCVDVQLLAKHVSAWWLYIEGYGNDF